MAFCKCFHEEKSSLWKHHVQKRDAEEGCRRGMQKRDAEEGCRREGVPEEEGDQKRDAEEGWLSKIKMQKRDGKEGCR